MFGAPHASSSVDMNRDICPLPAPLIVNLINPVPIANLDLHVTTTVVSVHFMEWLTSVEIPCEAVRVAPNDVQTAHGIVYSSADKYNTKTSQLTDNV